MRLSTIRNEAAIVLIGDFNPAIVRPGWLALNNIFSKDEADNAEIDVIHSAISSFTISWADFTVQKERFQVTVGDNPLIRVSDTVTNIFGNLLMHTPVRAVGINRQVSFSVGSLEKRNSIGFRLAPPEAWGNWGQEIRPTDENQLNNSGLINLTMQAERQDIYEGHIQARVGPDNSSSAGDRIGMHINDHYQISTEGHEEETASTAVKILHDQFDNSINQANNIIDQVMRLAEEN